MIPVREFIWEFPFNQSDILKQTVLHTINTQYPICYKYTLKFLKSLLFHCEQLNLEIDEELLTLYTHTLSTIDSSQLTPPPTFKTYFLKNQDFVVVKEDQLKITNGTTGLRVWPSCLRLISYCIKHEEFVKNKNFVELGCGVGLLSLSLVCLGAKRVCLTDFEPNVLRRTRENVQIFYETHKDISRDDIGMKMLDWSECTTDIVKSEFHSLQPFTVICADVVYDPSIISILVETFKAFIESGICEEIMVWSTVRNPKTYESFLSLLNQSFSHEQLEFISISDDEPLHYLDETTESTLLRIKPFENQNYSV